MSDNKDECIFLKRDTEADSQKTKHDFCNYIAVCTAYGEDPSKILRFDEDDIAVRCKNMIRFERCDRWREKTN